MLQYEIEKNDYIIKIGNMNEIISEYQDRILIKSNSINQLTEEKVCLSDKISKLNNDVQRLFTQKSQESLNSDLSQELNLL